MTFIFFFNDTATTEIYTLSLHDALPIYATITRFIHLERPEGVDIEEDLLSDPAVDVDADAPEVAPGALRAPGDEDRKSTRLNSSHANISYAVFCLKKKKKHRNS